MLTHYLLSAMDKNAVENRKIVVYYVYFLIKSTCFFNILVPACTRKMKQE
jgi:hypothetical protein